MDRHGGADGARRRYGWLLLAALLALAACGGDEIESRGAGGMLWLDPGEWGDDGEPLCLPPRCRPPPLAAGFTSPMHKVYRDSPHQLPALTGAPATLEMARGEYEATQLVVRADAPVPGVTVELSPLLGPGGPIPAADIEIRVVGHVHLSAAKVAGSRTGWLPDPLLPDQPLTLAAGVPQSWLITLRSRPETAPGGYQGSVKIRSNGLLVKRLPLRLTVWNFTLPKSSRFKAASFGSWERVEQAWPAALGFAPPTEEERTSRYLRIAEIAFRNRLPPTGFLANGLRSSNRPGQVGTDYGWPTHDLLPDGTRRFNAARTDRFIDYLLDRGANHLFIAFTSNIYLYPELTAGRRTALLGYLRDYIDHLRRRGLLKLAYIYGVDEPWGEEALQARQTFTLIRQELGPELRFMQNLNQNNPTAIGEFLGFFDALDINLGFYDLTRAADYRRQYPAALADLWWNINVWPATHPNLFLEYPLTDARIIGPLSYKYQVGGFEYWELMSLNGVADYRPLDPGQLLAPWNVYRNSLDGTLVYPAADQSVFSSLRFENLRDGLEDLEYLYLLEQAAPGHPLLTVPIVSGLSSFERDPEVIAGFRRRVGELLNGAGVP